MPCAWESGGVADDQEDCRGGLGPDSWHGDQDLAKREGIEKPFDFERECLALLLEGFDLLGDAWDDGLLSELGEHVIDEVVDDAMMSLSRPCFHSCGARRRKTYRAAVSNEQIQREGVR